MDQKSSPAKESIVDSVVRVTYRNHRYKNVIFDNALGCMNCNAELVFQASDDYIICMCCFSGWRDRRLTGPGVQRGDSNGQ